VKEGGFQKIKPDIMTTPKSETYNEGGIELNNLYQISPTQPIITAITDITIEPNIHQEKYHEIQLNTWERAKCYFSVNYKCLKFFCGSKKVLKDIDSVKSASADLNWDFNTKNIFDKLRYLSA
jgi:hypothetical protein